MSSITRSSACGQAIAIKTSVVAGAQTASRPESMACRAPLKPSPRLSNAPCRREEEEAALTPARSRRARRGGDVPPVAACCQTGTAGTRLQVRTEPPPFRRRDGRVEVEDRVALPLREAHGGAQHPREDRPAGEERQIHGVGVNEKKQRPSALGGGCDCPHVLLGGGHGRVRRGASVVGDLRPARGGRSPAQPRRGHAEGVK